MAAKIFIGNVGYEGIATGPHIHEYVKDLRTGQYIDPRTFQSPLLDVRIGAQETPLAIKDPSGKIVLNPAVGAQVTSEFGSRSAPTAGASSFHQGRDIALPYGTPVKYFGAGQFTPQTGVQGFGNLGTITTPDQRYEIGFGHMSSLGKPSNVPASTPDTSTGSQTPSYADSQQRTKDLLEAFMYGAVAGRNPNFQEVKAKSLADQMKEQLLGSMLGGVNPYGGLIDPNEINKQLTSAIYG